MFTSATNFPCSLGSETILFQTMGSFVYLFFFVRFFPDILPVYHSNTLHGKYDQFYLPKVNQTSIQITIWKGTNLGFFRSRRGVLAHYSWICWEPHLHRSCLHKAEPLHSPCLIWPAKGIVLFFLFWREKIRDEIKEFQIIFLFVP